MRTLQTFGLTLICGAAGMLAPLRAATAREVKHDPKTNPHNHPDDVNRRVESLLSRMTLAEKVGQMTQVERNTISEKPSDIRRFSLGSILSGGGQVPTPNTKEAWADMTDSFQREALASRLGIPLIYGIDAIHGHNNLSDAVMFPHNLGLGAAGDRDLVRAVARATAVEVAATGIRWNFAPVAAIPQDLRWGRVYEAFGEESNLVTALTPPYIEGLQDIGLGRAPYPPGSAVVLATAKHFIADGASEFGTGIDNLVDRGNARIDEYTLRTVHLPPYEAAIAAGAETIMVSYSSWNGTKMHASRYLLTDVLKGELAFKGFLISDWMALDELGNNERTNIKTAILAGLDMVMVPTRYESFIANLIDLVNTGEIPLTRIDDAVRRILRVKMRLGLFEQPFADRTLLAKVGSPEHRKLARTAVARSQVLLKNEGQLLPLAKNQRSILVAGEGADDIGLQCGGWTLDWQGHRGNITTGVSILDGIRSSVTSTTHIDYRVDGSHKGAKAAVGIAVVAELPYAEFKGDVRLPELRPEDRSMIAKVRAASEKMIIIVLSGRPLLMTPEIEVADAVIAAFLPGSEGNGITDVMFGNEPFTGRLPISWPRSADGLARRDRTLNNILFEYGHGIQTGTLP